MWWVWQALQCGGCGRYCNEVGVAGVWCGGCGRHVVWWVWQVLQCGGCGRCCNVGNGIAMLCSRKRMWYCHKPITMETVCFMGTMDMRLGNRNTVKPTQRALKQMNVVLYLSTSGHTHTHTQHSSVMECHDTLRAQWAQRGHAAPHR